MLRGFAVTRYLAACIAEAAPDLALDASIAAQFLPDGVPRSRPAGELVQAEYTATLRTIATETASTDRCDVLIS